MKRLLTVVAACAIAWVTGCSGGGSSTPIPPPAAGFTNASLKGTYVFSMTGTAVDTATDSVGSFSRIGVFIADGGGNIQTTGGLLDNHEFGSNNTFAINGGSYVVNADGRGNLSVITSGGTVQFSIALTSPSSGYMVDVVSGTSTTADTETASGSFQLQTSTSLAAGTYIFDFSGIDPASGNALSFVGDLVASGAGSGTFSPGSFADINDGGNIASKASIAGGSYATDNNNPGTGRGLATIDGLDYVYYVIDSQHVQFMDIDTDLVNVGTNLGEAVAEQASSPTNVSSFSNNSFVFVLGGSNVTDGGPHTRAVRLTATGGALSAILLDDNNEGTFVSVPATGVISSGTVTLDGDGSGRGTFSFTNASNTFTFVFYLSSATQGVIQDVSTVEIAGVPTPVEVADGALLAQTGAPFSSSSLATNYAFNWSGVTSRGEEDYVGSFAPASAAQNGLVDFNEFGTGSLFFNNTFNGVITVGGDGTGSTGQHSTFVATITGTPQTTINYFAYIANPNTILIMGTANSGARLIAGVLTAQTP